MSRFVRIAVLFLTALFLLCGNAFAANRNWEGDVSSDWNDPNNWQGNAFPGVANDATINPSNYTNAPVISVNSTHGFKKLTISGGGILTVQANLTVTDDITVTGTNSRLNVSAGTLTISSGNKNLDVLAGGTINHSGGTITFTGLLDIQNSTYNLSGTGTLNVGTSLYLTAASANTSFNISGGTANIPTSVSYQAATAAISATISVSGGTFTNSGPTYFKDSENDLTYFNVSGGTATLAGVVSDNTTGKIDITVSGTGSLKFQNNLTMEASDVITQTGGTITFEGGNRTWANAGTLNATGGDIVFNDGTATVLSGAGTWGFNNIVINSGKVLTQNASTINVRGNWTNSGGTFNESTNTVVFNGTGTQTITGAETFYRLTSNKSSGHIALASNVVASNTLTMTQGNIDAGANKITLGTGTGNTGTLSYTAGAIIGNFERWIASTGVAISFPVGTSSYYRPASATFTNLTNGSLIVKFVASDPGSTGLTLSESSLNVTNQFTEGYWDFTAANSLASTNYRVDLTGTNFTSYSLVDIVRVLKRTNGASSWTLQGTHVALSGSTASRSALNGIATAQFGFGRVACPSATGTVAQSVTTEVAQGTTNNEIIRIAVNSSGATCTGLVTQFNFTTAGTPGCSAPSADISNAKVYYTGTSSTFATSTLFGSLGSAPNGAFSITGSQTITSNTVYFWLVYDIPASATVSNVVDGQLVSFVFDGTTTTSLTTPDPAGSRSVKAERYAVNSGGSWNAASTWAYTSGGASGASVPTASTSVFIPSGYTVNVNASGAVAKTITITGGGSRALLNVTTGGTLTCDSVSINTTSKRAELYVFNTGQLTVNRGYRIDHTNGTEANIWALWVGNTATASIGRNIDIVNPSAFNSGVLLDGSSITTVSGNINFAGNANDRATLGMGGTARLNIKGALSITATKYGKLYNTDAAHTSVINFNGTSAQTMELTPSASNSNLWQYSTVWINNPSGVTLNANIGLGPTYATVQKGIIVKSGILKSGGYSINLLNSASSFFQVDNGATYQTTSTDSYGGLPYFGTNQGSGDITFGATSTIIFSGAGQTVPILSGTGGTSYGHVTFSGSGTKTLGKPHHANFSGTGGFDVDGNITIANGVQLDVSATNYNITIAGNWTDQNAVAGTGFNRRAGTVTFDGTVSQTITPTASPLTFNNFTVNKASGTLNIATSDVSVAGALTMTAGNINSGTRKLTLGTSTASVGTYSRTSGTIIGKFERYINATSTNIIFPVGTASYYRPDTLYFTNLTPGSLIVEFIASTPTTGGLPVSEGVYTVGTLFSEGYWSCTAANSLASTNYKIMLGLSGFTSNNISSITRVVKRADSASSWTLSGTHVAATSSSAARSGLSGFSEFGIGATSCTPAVNPNLTVTSQACNNSTNGAITLSVSGGTSPYSYLWSNGAVTQNLSSLAEGTYTVTITDVNQCTATASGPVGVQVSMSVTHATDYYSPNGAIDVTVSGGTAPYTYLWNKKDDTITTQDRTGLENGWHTVTVTDNAGCKKVKSAALAYMDTIHAGSYIVNMGVSPQTIGNGLKPYGFIYDMVRNYNVPVEWVINPDKAQDGIDFSLDGTDYKGGPFVIEAEYFDNTLDSRVTYWESQGVVGDYTTTDIVVPVYAIITGFSNLGIDEASDGIVTPYFANASVPSSIYYVGLPSVLGFCDNAYVLPHADPTWADHKYLKDFVEENGYVWIGCHAVSVLEGIYNPLNTAERMNFLSQTGLQCYGAGDCGSLISQTHGAETATYTYDANLASHPLMQFMGDMTPAQTGGSERWYIPLSTGGWNAGTMRGIRTGDGSAGKEGVKLAFGAAYDNKDNGLVMYQGGHSLTNGATANQVAAQRAFFNFILHSSFDRRLIAEADIPSSMAEGTMDTLSATVLVGESPFTYQWSTNVNGTFGSSTSATTTFTLNAGNGRNNARISVVVTDNCGKTYFETKTIYVLYVNGASVSDYNGYNISCNGGSDGSIRVAGEGGTPPYTYAWSHGPTTNYVSGLSAGTYYVTITDAALVSVYDTINLTEPPAVVSANAVGTGTILCYGDLTGGVDLTASGGVAPYAYLWSSGETTEDLSGISTGTYTVTVTDDNGCYASAPVSIGPDSLTISPAVTNTTCPYSTNGSVDITISGGTAAYAYLWSTGATTEDISGRPTGSYTVTVTDDHGCTASVTQSIASASNIASNFFVIDVSVHGGSNGVITQSVSNGVAPYSYVWSHGPTTKDVNSLIAGDYTVTITDANSCTITKSATVDEPGVCPCAWLGTTSDDWNEVTNWACGFLPTDTCNAIIQAGVYPCNVLSGTASCKDLTISAGDTFEIAPGATLNVYGNIVNNGTFIRNNSTVKLVGTSEQSISGTSVTRFHNLEINNASATGVQMNGNIEVFGELKLINGYLFANGDSVKMMNATPANLSTFSSNSFVVGKITRKISDDPNLKYEFPVGDAGDPARYFRATVRSFELQGTNTLTVWFDSLKRHSNEQLASAFYSPPTDMDTYYNYTVPYVEVAAGDTNVTTAYTSSFVNGVMGAMSAETMSSASNYVNIMFNMEKTSDADRFIYSTMAPEGMWYFEPDEQPSGGYYHMLLYTGSITGLVDNNFGILKRPSGSNGNYWSGGGGIVKPFFGFGRMVGHGYAMRMYLTTFSEAGIGRGGGYGLPIELIEFNAEMAHDGEVEITWATATETNNNYFTIEKSNGNEFKEIATIPGAGNSSTTIYYSKIDYDPYIGTNYYRLKQTDYDGKYTYSDVVAVNYNPDQAEIREEDLVIYPNPTTGAFNVTLKNITGDVSLLVFDGSGKLIMEESYNPEGEATPRRMTMQNLANGIYYLKVNQAGEVLYTRKVMLLAD